MQNFDTNVNVMCERTVTLNYEKSSRRGSLWREVWRLHQQESIPAGCVTPAYQPHVLSVATRCQNRCGWGPWTVRSHAWVMVIWDPSHVNRQTDTTDSITFAQLHWGEAIKIFIMIDYTNSLFFLFFGHEFIYRWTWWRHETRDKHDDVTKHVTYKN